MPHFPSMHACMLAADDGLRVLQAGARKEGSEAPAGSAPLANAPAGPSRRTPDQAQLRQAASPAEPGPSLRSALRRSSGGKGGASEPHAQTPGQAEVAAQSGDGSPDHAAPGMPSLLASLSDMQHPWQQHACLCPSGVMAFLGKGCRCSELGLLGTAGSSGRGGKSETTPGKAPECAWRGAPGSPRSSREGGGRSTYADLGPTQRTSRAEATVSKVARPALKTP
jgi:hypothetical protein